MNDSEKLDFLINIVTDLTSRLDDMEQRITSLESAQEDFQSRNAGDFLDIREKLTALNDAQEDFQSRNAGDFLDVREKLTALNDANSKNSKSLGSSVMELRSALNATRKETVNFVRHAIANESFEKGSEEKNVAIFNITNRQISSYRNHDIKERDKCSEEAVKSFLNELAHDTIKELNEGDIESIRTISHQTSKGVHSAVISFVSVGDAQKFNARINSNTESTLIGRRCKNSMLRSRLGLTKLQRNLLANADFIGEKEDSQGIKRRSRNSRIRELASCETLWTSIGFEPLDVFHVGS